RSLFAVLSILSLLASCAQMSPQPTDMTQAVKNARTSADHNALAKRYEDAVREMEAKVQEHKNELEEYEYRSDHYGKRAQDLQAHCRGLIRYYEQAAEANGKMAEIHRQLAAELK
ncbi:MAG: hypothetical protein ACRD39_06385, partial [Nitrososphaeraceae archaeon]